MRDAAFFLFFPSNHNHNESATKNHKHPIVGNKIYPCRKLFIHAEAFYSCLKLFSLAGSFLAWGKLFSHAG